MSQASTLQSKRALYVGGVATAVKLDTLRAAFIPFGPINHIEMPMDYERGTHKGFAFIEFQDADDASEAIYNMDGAELFSKALTVNVAQASRMNLDGGKAIWSTDDYFDEKTGGAKGNEADRAVAPDDE
ncbi:hypothetical protein THAOC_28735 [Thalassiosira oceanica]|uniref:RRM domain-containing protein n=1 Tax=Thalassiosira oceanica TaxID=159749 RepID=K0RFJ8_THAOC|nr:hypothetical protein THAOC_28735 [Thalassiosira oceanica]|mmetsp:Transcript_19151/g.44817  ORF Transcript_19151/g.44817 Transcript_19151/m.44817 type:complete len:129 (-) Transcript_19151:272-658(-)|eukprot:EJK52035.1 hypothetical protein THAOC_28735 [Thalassiosira oceanica]